jgi:hypothetical protein
MDTQRLRRRLILFAALLLAGAAAAELRVRVQRSPLAGFQYHEGPALWDQLRTGDRLELVREENNPHDRRAIAVLWQGHKLGYLPRAENDAVSDAMDRGHRLEARIGRLREERNPWRRLEVEVFVVPQ